MDRARPGGKRASSFGVRARLLGLVLIPSIGLALIAGDEVSDHRGRADDARRLAADVSDAALSLDAFVASTHEFRLVETAVQAGNLGVPLDAAGDLLGMDLVAELADVRIRVDANPLTSALLDVVGGAERLELARANLDDRGADHPVFADLVITARDAWHASMAAMTARDGDVEVDPQLRRALHSLQTSADLFQASNDQLVLVSEAAVPGSATPLASSEDLDRVAARYEVALEHALADADPHIRPALQRTIAEDGGAFAATLADVGVGDGGAIDVAGLAEIFRHGLALDENLQELTAVASADALEHAVAVGADAEAQYRRTLLVVLGLLTATVVLALLVAGSISRPLRRLAQRAAEVTDGELDGPPLAPAGPPETAVLARTLNDAVDNLRAVEGRMAALAAGDLAAAADGATPGKLGQLVGRSVDSLGRSIAERDRLQRRLAHEAAHDALTGLANRRTATATLRQMLRDGGQVGFLFLDLDDFKLVNDEQGHAVGDVLLTVTADRLSRAAPEGALVARLGGDEFVVAVQVDSEQAALALAHRLAEGLARPVHVDGLPHRVSVSVGVAISRPGDDADHLMRSADAALREAKRTGRGSIVALDSKLRAGLEAQHRLEADLRTAIARDRLELHYQPVFEAEGALHGAEALVRWRREDNSLVSPDDFIPTAERSGLILELDRWVLDRGLQQLGRWRAGPFPDLRLSINVSASSLLSSHLVGDVRSALRRAGVPGAALIIEVTETALLHDLDRAAEHITQLRSLGVGTSVDDFGTGYTSVAHLRRLPVSEVKIDRSFVHAIDDDGRDRALVDLVLRIGNALALDVVAEGVETEEQLDALRSLGCRFAQGYLLGRPMPAAELEQTHGLDPTLAALPVPTETPSIASA